MKRLDELTADDMTQFPIWKFIDPAKPEIEPWPKKGAAPLLSIVQTECVAANGTAYAGRAILTKINLVSPVVFSAERQIELYHGEEPSLEWKTAAYQALGCSADQFFPVVIRMVVSSQHHPLQAKYDGFLYRSPEGTFTAVR